MKKALLSIAAAAVCMTGMANAQGISKEEVIELYVGTFNRAADAAGLRYWIHDRLKSQEEQAKAFFHSVEAYKLYPAWMNHRDLIRTIYHNLFGRYPEEAGIAYWTEQLENGTFERDTMLLAIMEGAMGQDAATIQNKVEVGKYFAQKGLNDIGMCKRVMKNVNADPKSVSQAKIMIDEIANPGWNAPAPVPPVPPAPAAPTVLSLQSEQTVGGSSGELFYGSVTDQQGNIYAAGQTDSNDGDIAGGNHGGVDGLLVKFAPDGTVLWQRVIGGTGDDHLYAIAIDASGALYVAGASSTNADGDITSVNHGGLFDALLMKYDADGNKLWDRLIGGTDVDQFVAVTVDGNAVYPAGSTKSSDGDIPANNGNLDALVAKTDNNGNLAWADNVGGSQDDSFAGITVSGGSLYMAGLSKSNDGDITSGNNGNWDALIVKYDPGTNAVTWNTTFGGSLEDRVRDIIEKDGHLYCAGRTYSSNGDVTDGNNGDSDGLLLKLDTNGAVTWDRTIGGSDYDRFYALTDAGELLYLAGETKSNDIDITDNNNGHIDAWIEIVDSDGNLKSDLLVGGSGHDEFLSIGKNDNFVFYSVGGSKSSDGDIVSGNKGGMDALWSRLE